MTPLVHQSPRSSLNKPHFSRAAAPSVPGFAAFEAAALLEEGLLDDDVDADAAVAPD